MQHAPVNGCGERPAVQDIVAQIDVDFDEGHELRRRAEVAPQPVGHNATEVHA